MLGAIIGDMVGSIYEFNSPKTKDFYFFNPNMKMTDDSLLTIAVAKTLLAHYPISYTPESLKAIQDDLAKEFVATFQRRPFAGFGGMFADWCIRCEEKGTRETPVWFFWKWFGDANFSRWLDGPFGRRSETFIQDGQRNYP